MVHVLKACGDTLTRENVMKQAANLRDIEVGGTLPGVRISTSPDDFAPIQALAMMTFDGKTWDRSDKLMTLK